MASECLVTGYPRVHLGLVDLSGATDRVYGGAGIAVEALPTVVRARAGTTSGVGPATLSPDLRAAITKALHRASKGGVLDGVGVDVLSTAPRHAGFGSTTTAVMCALRAVTALATVPFSRAQLSRLSGRGRTSGSGVNAFFDGGFVVDAGQPRHKDADGYQPSSTNAATVPSQHLTSVPMPPSWQITFASHSSALANHGGAEVDFFRRHTPTSTQDTLLALADLYHGILPAIIEENLDGFAQALRRFQSRGFKRAEVANQSAPVRALLAEMSASTGYACGLSSMGPLVFVVHATGEQPLRGVATAGFTVLGPFGFRNGGHSCRWVS
jgi:beta-ribofuranosylaminobenzene 5'-phosphate synthase